MNIYVDAHSELVSQVTAAHNVQEGACQACIGKGRRHPIDPPGASVRILAFGTRARQPASCKIGD